MDRQEKINIAKDLTDKMSRAKAAFLVDFKGIKVDGGDRFAQKPASSAG